MGAWRQQWTISYQVWGEQYSREKKCLINWSHTRSTGEMSLKNSAGLRVTVWPKPPWGSWRPRWEGSRWGWERKPPSWLATRATLPRHPLTAMSRCCTPNSWLPGFALPGDIHLMSWRAFCLNLEGWVGIEIVDPIVTISPSPDCSQGTGFSQENLPTILGGNVKCTDTLENRLFFVKPDICLP